MVKLIYLDNSATTPISEKVLKEVNLFQKENFGNPSSQHQIGRKARSAIEFARKKIAEYVGAESNEIYFTSGGTESNNLAILGLAKAYPEKKHIITSKIEHPAVLEPIRELQKQGYLIDYAPVNQEGIVDTSFISNKISKTTLLVSIMHINNEIGTIQPIEEIAKICEKNQVFFHTDAVQSFGKIKINVKSGISLLSASGHKINAQKGIGILYIKKGIKIKPLLSGGGQENNIRSGTENTPGIISIYSALSLKRKDKEVKKARDLLLKELLKIPGAKLNGSLGKRIYNNIHISFYGIEGESLLLLLDKSGICVSTGSACSSHKLEESHVLRAIGVDDLYIHGSLRLTLDTLKPLTPQEINFIAKKIKESVLKLREMSPFKYPGDEKGLGAEACYNESLKS